MAMESPVGCVGLLAQYLCDEMKDAKGQLERYRNWEAPHPHSHLTQWKTSSVESRGAAKQPYPSFTE